jgi:hypothetical protein
MARPKLPYRLFASLIALMLLLTVASTMARARKAQGGSPLPARAARQLQREDPRGFRANLWNLADAKDPAKAAQRLIRAAMLEVAGIEQSDAGGGGGPDGLLLAAGDLNADGRQDAVNWFLGDGIQAVRGSDGQGMWTREFGGFGIPVFVDDVDGVSGADILTVDYTTTELTGAYRTSIAVQALSGRTGNTVWTRTYENPWTVVKSGPTKGSADLDFAIPMATADLDADGSDDLLMGRYDVVTVKDSGTGLRDVRTAAVFEAVSGKTGRPTAAFAAEGRWAVPDASVIPDLTGDDADDVLVLSASRSGPNAPSSGRLTAFSGKGGAPAWVANLQLPGWYYLDGVELDGDDRADVLVTSYFGMQYVALSGRTGVQMWSIQEQDAYYLVPAGDVNGDNGQDLLMLISGFFEPPPQSGSEDALPAETGSLKVPPLPGHQGDPYSCYGDDCVPPPYTCYGYGGCEPPIDCFAEEDGGTGVGVASHYGYGYGPYCYADGLRLVDGALGSVLWEERYPGYVEVLDDATGDGIADAVSIDFYFTGSDGGYGGDETWGTQTDLLSGRDGTTAWTHQAERGFTFPLGADLDGDGGSDLADFDYSGKADRYTAVSGKTGQSLWPGPGPGKGFVVSLEGAALGGEGMDLLETRYRRGDLSSGARSGADGSLLWKSPNPTSPPPE